MDAVKIADGGCLIYGYSAQDILKMGRFLDTWMLTVDDLTNIEVRKHFHERKFIMDNMMHSAGD